MSLITDFLRKNMREEIFSRYFIINFSCICLRDQIFRVLLEHFIFEVVRK